MISTDLAQAVTPECQALISLITTTNEVDVNHTTISNINGDLSGGYTRTRLAFNRPAAVPGGFIRARPAYTGVGNRLLSTRFVPTKPFAPDPNAPPGQIQLNLRPFPTQPFDVDQPESISYSINLLTAEIRLQNTLYPLTSCPDGKFAIVKTPTSIEVFSFIPRYPIIIN